MSNSPFKGLVPFEDSAADATLFFGREREREIIVANLVAARLTVLYGASGVGKSSILRAGVAHQLRELALQNLEEVGEREHAVVVFSSWSGNPVPELRERIAVELFGRPVDSGEGSLADVLQEWTEDLNLALYLVLDQAEEYFVYHGLERGETSFAAELPELVTRPGLRVNTLLGLREDALASLDVFKGRIPNLLANRLRLDHLGRDAARMAIEGPLEAYNADKPEGEQVSAEAPLVETVLSQVATGAVGYARAGRGQARSSSGETRIETPYLQLVMQRLWEVEQEAGSRVLRLETLNELGGAQRIVEDHLEHALATLSPAEKDAAAGMFHYLVTPSGTKIAHDVADLVRYAAVDEPELQTVLRRLSEERILRPLSNGGGAATYEIFHDVLADAVLGWRDRHHAQQEVERARLEAERRHRRLLVVVGASLLALAAMAAVTVFALTQRSDARSQARHAQARELAATALSGLAADPQRSLQRAVQAARIEDSPNVEEALRQALLHARLRLILPAGGPLTTASFDHSGRRVLTAGKAGDARLFDAGSGRVLHVLPAGSPVTTAAFSPDGRLAVTGSSDGSAKLWDARSGRRLHDFARHASVTVAAFDPEGKLLVTAGTDGVARVWRVPGGRLVRAFGRKGQGHVFAASFSPDSSVLLTAAGDAARLHSVGTGRLLHILPSRDVRTAAFSPDRTLVATGGSDRKARIWDAGSGRLLHVLGEQGGVTALAFDRKGELLVTASSDGAARVWHVPEGTKVAVMTAHTNGIKAASFSPDGNWVVTASRDGSAATYDAGSGRMVASLHGHGGSVVSASYGPRGDRVVTASEDGTARVWDPGTAPQLHVLGRHAGPVRTAVFSPDGRRVVSASDDGTARVWRVRDRHVRVLRHGGNVTSAAFSPDGRRILTTSRNGTARIWRGSAFVVLRQGGPVTTGAFSRDGQLVATAGEDGTARTWRARDGAALQVLRHGAAVRAVAFDDDGATVLTAGDDGTARIWETSTGSLLHVLRGHDDAIVSASFSPDGRRVVTASDDTTAIVWDAVSGRRLHELAVHRNRLTAASFSADGRLVALSSVDGDGSIWSVATGKLLHLLRGHFGLVSDAGFSPDGRWVVTAGPVSAGLWPTSTGQILIYLLRHKPPWVTVATFSPDGRRILTAGLDGRVQLYRCTVCLRVDGLVREAEGRLAAPVAHLSAAERRRYGVG
jgi:WD40 repeat protein